MSIRNDNATLQGESAAILTLHFQTLDHPLKRGAMKLNNISSGVVAANRTEAQKRRKRLHAPPLFGDNEREQG